eukprot:8571058-Pyramimonas_sp.AAC.1
MSTPSPESTSRGRSTAQTTRGMLATLGLHASAAKIDPRALSSNKNNTTVILDHRVYNTER